MMVKTLGVIDENHRVILKELLGIDQQSEG